MNCDDVHKLITRMDDILELLEDGAQTITLQDIKAVAHQLGKLPALCLACVENGRTCAGLLQDT